VASFNLAMAVAVTPAAFAGLTTSGVFAWDGFVSFWVKIFAFLAWLASTYYMGSVKACILAEVGVAL
jgi:hypothetical protein